MKSKRFSISPLELARKAGLEYDELQLDTKVKNAIAALEIAGYVRPLHERSARIRYQRCRQKHHGSARAHRS